MVARPRRTNSRPSLPPAPSMTAMLLRKSRLASTHSRYVTNVVLNHGEQHVGSSLDEHVASDDGHPSRHHELPPLFDNLLRVPTTIHKHPVRPLLTRSLHHSAIPSDRSSQEAGIISENPVRSRSNHQIYLNAQRIDQSSPIPTSPHTSSFISLYHSATSFYSLEHHSSYASIDPSFYSAQESLELDCHSHQGVVSKDFLPVSSQHQQSPLPTENISAEPGHDELQPRNGSQGTESSEEPTSTGQQDSADESFRCRGLSSSQITPDSRYQPSDQKLSPSASDQNDSQPSSDQRGYNGPTDKKSDQAQSLLTDKHGIIGCCQQSHQIPNKTEVDNSLITDDDHHSEAGSLQKVGLTRQRVSNSTDEVAIGQLNRSSPSSQAPSATPNPMHTMIPASIDLDQNTGIFRCPTLRRVIANFGPRFIAFNDKRKKFQVELHAKMRVKFHHNINKDEEVVSSFIPSFQSNI
ncbi:hypothetical protein PCASD_20985 [Puccinia coronata f. sp. avenae]|uniref:Uncharacterized protein n=1 Tax=Puccinia coronata f. sp. avenae TaxID=200324 RepID=A0A2N5SI87_9BASI|nr:hypothetical protein PCASD_20985 [Puccinia coronata f. sp. avenae]